MTPIETEAKFSFRDESAFPRWLTAASLGRFSLGPVRVKHTEDQYLDSAEHACLAAGYACRVRTSGGVAVATLKSLADSDGARPDGVRRRAEYEVELSPPPESPPVAGGNDTVPVWQQPWAWPESAARELALRILQGQPLVHLTWIRQERHEREILDGERSVALLSLDRVHFENGRPPMLELEIELVETGTEADLEELVPTLRGDPAFEPAARSKLLTALDGRLPRPLLLAVPPAAATNETDPLLQTALHLLDAVDGVESEAAEHSLLAEAVRLLRLGVEAQPEDPGAAARDLLLAGPAAGVAEDDRLPLAAILGLQSLLDEQLRTDGRLRLGRKRAADDPAFATLGGPETALARRLAVVVFTARQLEAGSRPLLTVTERCVTLVPPGGMRPLPVEQLAPLWEKTTGRVLEVAGADGRRRLGLRYDQPLATAGRTVLRSQLARLRDSIGDLEGEGKDEVEALHDARVATRRMRTLLRLLKDAYPRRERRRHLRALKRAGDLLGAVRDLDVLIAGALEEQSLRGTTPGLLPLIASWEEERRQARRKLLAHVESDGFAAWLRELEAFVAASSTGKSGDVRLCDALPELIWKRYGVVRAYQPRVRTASLPELHELRKDVKQLRYLLEFFAELLGDEVEALVERSVRVQDALGLLHDVVARRDRLAQSPASKGGAEESAVSAFRLLTLGEITRRRRAFEELWPEVSTRGFRRDLAAAAATV